MVIMPRVGSNPEQGLTEFKKVKKEMVDEITSFGIDLENGIGSVDAGLRYADRGLSAKR